MAAIAIPEMVVDAGMPTSAPPVKARRKGRTTRLIILIVCGLYFLIPLVSTLIFTVYDQGKKTVSFDAYSGLFSAEGFTTSFGMSLELAVIAIVITLALLIPTMLLVTLKYPQMRGIVEIICLMPLVFPPVVLVVGIGRVLSFGPDQLAGTPLQTLFNSLQGVDLPLILAFEYVILALPFSYRALDAGLKAIDVRTLVEAAQNLGAKQFTIITRIVLPSLRTAVFNASFLAFALVMGEYTIAKILSFKPFAVWLVQLPSTNGRVQMALALLSLVITWLLLIVISRFGRQKGEAK